ncbi:hypothetical protein Goshw_012662 [Gossypium schwendimanii]|uniref:Uncharacterized protein n=1 Tax=Gossypium schwendimanii TaxID=34291 RepID=A0A7J9M3F6_GOSSC|nr:hypothetical protein [Gossypium schwendimanii]
MRPLILSSLYLLILPLLS